ncbi:MAG: Rpn family recombination-promoting nuclease/putative transposase [Magnetococcales bacterium]|nr:Rpn family recombination-promoting nuclease/putative transposase [Magnetococcales bacterium]
MELDERGVAQPHDRFFKALLADPESAGALLRERLPGEVVALLASDPPELVEGSFIDDELQGHVTDRLYRVRLVAGSDAFVYTLLEHKSYPDRWVAFQFYRYVSRILEQWGRENPGWEKLPPVIPVVVYHGATQWTISDELHALMAGIDALRPYLPNFHFVIVDLGEIDDGALSNDPRLRAGLLALKYVFRKGEQLGILEAIGVALQNVPDMLYQVVLYIAHTYENVDEIDIRKVIQAARPREDAKMLSKFARDILDGKSELAKEVMRQEGEASLLLRLMRRRFGQLPDWVATKIKGADTHLLETWSDRIFDAKSVEEIFSA